MPFALFGLLLAGVPFVYGEPGMASNWPQWRGPGRDGKSTETDLLRSWPEGGPEQVWSAGGLGRGSSPPSVTSNRVYIMGLVGTDEVLSALGHDGKQKWRTPCGRAWKGHHEGSRCQPAVDEDRLYFITSLIHVGCVDAGTGRVLWALDAMKEFGGVNRTYGNAESPLIVDPAGGGAGGKMIVTPGGPNATMVALDKHTGEPLWTTRKLSHPACYCSPILVERGGLQIIVTMVKEGLVGVNAADGSVLWFASHRNRYDNHMNTPVFEDGLLYFTSGYGSGGQMFRLSKDGKSIEKLWQQLRPDTMHGGVVLVDGHIYGSSYRQPKGGKWVCLEAATGKVVYERAWVKAGSVTYADGHLYCYGEGGRVALVPARPDVTAPTGRFSIPHAGGQHCTHPVVCGGRLYLRRGDTLTAFQVAPWRLRAGGRRLYDLGNTR